MSKIIKKRWSICNTNHFVVHIWGERAYEKDKKEEWIMKNILQ